MPIFQSAMRGVREALLENKTSGVGQVRVIPASFNKHAVFVIGSPGVSAGAVQIEMADNPDFAGTWAPFGTPITVPVNGQTIVNVNGPLIFIAIRARITTPVTGGNVTVQYLGAP